MNAVALSTTGRAVVWEIEEAKKAISNDNMPGLAIDHLEAALDTLRRGDGQPEQRNTHDVLAEVAGTLIEILAELRRGNSTAREGAVSSIKIEDMTSKEKPIKILTSYYIGSTITVDDVREAVDLHEYAHADAERRALAGWQSTVDSLTNGAEA